MNPDGAFSVKKGAPHIFAACCHSHPEIKADVDVLRCESCPDDHQYPRMRGEIGRLHFVQNVESLAFVAMLPVLSRSLNDKVEKVKRTCCLIVANMCKVVENPAAVIPIMSKLDPFVKVACEKLSNPEPRNMAERTLKTLHKSAEGAESKMVIASKAFAFIKQTLDDKSSDREDSISTDSLTRATTDLVPLCKPAVKQSLGMWLEDVAELFNIKYME